LNGRAFVLTDEILSSRDANKILMENIRSLVQELKGEEQLTMDRRNEVLQAFFKSTTIITVVSLIIALVTIFTRWSCIIVKIKQKRKQTGALGHIARNWKQG
jgi:CHASE3 domain sensor protein